jgi:hypothetical protein
MEYFLVAFRREILKPNLDNLNGFDLGFLVRERI